MGGCKTDSEGGEGMGGCKTDSEGSEGMIIQYPIDLTQSAGAAAILAKLVDPAAGSRGVAGSTGNTGSLTLIRRSLVDEEGDSGFGFGTFQKQVTAWLDKHYTDEEPLLDATQRDSFSAAFRVAQEEAAVAAVAEACLTLPERLPLESIYPLMIEKELRCKYPFADFVDDAVHSMGEWRKGSGCVEHSSNNSVIEMDLSEALLFLSTNQ